MRTARSEPTASMTVKTSSMRSSSVATVFGRSESPTPRLSKRITREKAASPRRNRAVPGSSQQISTWLTNPSTIIRSRSPSSRV